MLSAEGSEINGRNGEAAAWELKTVRGPPDPCRHRVSEVAFDPQGCPEGRACP
jgi:hypothetical protein